MHEDNVGLKGTYHRTLFASTGSRTYVFCCSLRCRCDDAPTCECGNMYSPSSDHHLAHDFSSLSFALAQALHGKLFAASHHLCCKLAQVFLPCVV